MSPDLDEALELLNVHRQAFTTAEPFAVRTGHTVPADTKSWSEILVGLLSGIRGRDRKKGSDLIDGSDVKAANVWNAIDTPRFNGCAPAGRTTSAARKPNDVTALDDMPHLFFVLWDTRLPVDLPRCRVWVVSPPRDRLFREMVGRWYNLRSSGEIKSDNFQLHPPRNSDSDTIRNSCGNLSYPLFFAAIHNGASYEITTYEPEVLTSGECRPA